MCDAITVPAVCFQGFRASSKGLSSSLRHRPSASICLVYRETRTDSKSGSNAHFHINMGGGSVAVPRTRGHIILALYALCRVIARASEVGQSWPAVLWMGGACRGSACKLCPTRLLASSHQGGCSRLPSGSLSSHQSLPTLEAPRSVPHNGFQLYWSSR